MNEAASSVSAGPTPTRNNDLFVLVATIGASAMAFIDGSVVQIALPAIQADFKTSFATLQWIVNIYTLFLGALVLVGGAYGDLLGRRLIFFWGTVLFVGASLACGLAPSAAILVAARAVQGIGAAMMVPQSLAIIAASFPKETRGAAIGTWAAASALTTALGPVIGGFLIDTLSWRAAFLINLPIGLVVLAITALKVPESRSQSAGGVDLPGGVLATLGLGALTVGLVYLPDRGILDPLVLGGFVIAVVALPAFVIREARTAAPMMPLDLFHDGVFTRVNILTVLLYGALSGALFLIPYTLISVQGYTAAEAGAALLPLGLIIGFFSRLAGSVGDRIGTRLPMIVGPSIVALSFAALAVTNAGGSYWVGVFGPIVGLSIGMAITVSPLTTTVMNSVGDQQTGVASGINNAAARVAGLLAVAISGALSIAIFSALLRTSVPALGLAPDASAALLAGTNRLVEAPILPSVPPDQAAAVHTLLADAYLAALRWVILLNAVLAAAAALVAWTIPSSRTKAAGPQASAK